jgi:hypothetical protein
MGIADTLSMGKTQVEGIKIQMEIEQKNLADIVCAELNELGFPCDVRKEGNQIMRAGVIPVRIERLRIASRKKLSHDRKKEFDVLKDKLTKEYAVLRQKQYKEEIKELKHREKK